MMVCLDSMAFLTLCDVVIIIVVLASKCLCKLVCENLRVGLRKK